MSVNFHIPELHTDRLRLRLPRKEDLAAHTEFRTSLRSKGVGGPYPPHESFDSLAGVIGQWQLRGYGRWMVADKVTDEPFGVVGVYHPEDWPEPEIAWSIYANAEGRGIAHEAALLTRDYVYKTLGWDRIVSLIMPDNDRSIRLAERLGCTNSVPFAHPSLGVLDIWVHPAQGDQK